MLKATLILCLFLGTIVTSCSNLSGKAHKQNEPQNTNADSTNDSSIVYKTDALIIHKLTKHVYVHTSFLNTTDYGKVPCNGMAVVNEKEAIIFDTPADNESSAELINYIQLQLHTTIKAIIPTHFHEDCVGGLAEFNKHNIPAYALNKTIELLKIKGKKFAQPLLGFNDSLAMVVGNKLVYAIYFGAGHTKDNIVGYFPDDNAIFGGCLIKEIDAPKGNVADADTNAWSATVLRLKQKYPQVKIVVPGHGKWGGTALYDYTIKLFSKA